MTIKIDLTINPTAQEVAAWNLIRPVLAAHLRKVNRVYRKANDSQKEIIREHCPIFNSVLKLTEAD